MKKRQQQQQSSNKKTEERFFCTEWCRIEENQVLKQVFIFYSVCMHEQERGGRVIVCMEKLLALGAAATKCHDIDTTH